MGKLNIVVGKEIWVNSTEHIRYSKATIRKVGRKYFYVQVGDYYTSDRNLLKFSIDNLRQDNGDFSPSWEIHATEQDILDKHEREKLFSKIRSIFTNVYSATDDLTLDRLRKIHAILFSEEG